MIICVICHQEINDDSLIANHYLSCWKSHSLPYTPKPAPRSETIETHCGEDNMLKWMERLKQNARS